MADFGINDNWLEELKSRTDILTVIGKYTRLTRKGRSYWGLCPFHHEKTPSFSVNPEGQFYHCFGCGVGGDVIKFVMQIESVDFMDAVKLLAEQAGMKLPEFGDGSKMREMKQKKDKLRAMMKDTARHYHENLMTAGGKPALDYLRQRGVEDKYIVRFGLGASLGFSEIIDFLTKKGYEKDLMVEAGIAEVKNGRYFDALFSRLIFPIFNNFGEVVAFGGRKLEKTDFAKYKNATNTVLFDKSKNLYGINLLSKLKQRERITSVIMVEGYMDTISLVQAGVENVVASMGTALTPLQAKKLKNYTDTVYICYDGDGAGQKATLRGLDILKDAGLKVLVMSLPDGMDPDDTVKKLGKEGFEKLMSEAKPLIEYKLYLAEKLLDGSLQGRVNYANSAVDVLRLIDGSVEKEAYLPKIAEKSKLSIDSLKRDLYDLTKQKKEEDPNVIQEVRIVQKPEKDMAYYSAARFILSAMLSKRDYAYEGESLSSYFDNSTHKDVYNYATLCVQEGKRVVAGNLYGTVDDEELDAILGTTLSAGDEIGEARFFKECVLRLKKRYLDKEIANLSARISEEKDADKKKELLNELNELILRSKKV
ncbi:MAG: DNA primase [Clostridia bacterium]|nr:DNA primase [Clostridia bacterium]